MIGIVGRMRVQPDRTGDFERLWLELQAAVDAKEPDCLVYRLTRLRGAPHTYRNIEVFRDQASLDAHNATDHLKTLGPRIAECLAGTPEVDYLDTVD